MSSTGHAMFFRSEINSPIKYFYAAFVENTF